MPDPIAEQRALLFNARVWMKYHQYRRAFFESWLSVTRVLELFAGGGTFLILLLGTSTASATTLSGLVTFFVILDSVVGFGSRAKMHNQLYRDFSDLVEEIEFCTHPVTAVDIAMWKKHKQQIIKEQPPTLELLVWRCSREVAIEMNEKIRPEWMLTPSEIWRSQWQIWPLTL